MKTTDANIAILLCLALLLAGSPLHADEPYEAIGQRLSLMRDVAAYKWINRQPIEVPEREALVIDNAIMSGLEFGITARSSEVFFRAQIEAARDIQRCWFDRWQASSPPVNARDLIGDVRPRLLELGSTIVRLLAVSEHDETRFMNEVSIECLSRVSRAMVFTALQQIQVYPDRITQIRQSGILRVGTTGDYAPFSFEDAAGSYSGIDIDMAGKLASALAVKLVLVKTSWPSLMEDLNTGRYDVAMSGVSRIPAREQQAYFTRAYHIGGKTPIARCDQAAAFSRLEAIDQAGIRVIVNPGGTNERFVDNNITRAEKLPHDDNRTIFAKIIGNEADVMITDLIEAQLQSSRHPELCMTMPGQTLTYQEKAYMMPKDSSLLAEVNRWLEEMATSGQLAKTFADHLP